MGAKEKDQETHRSSVVSLGGEITNNLDVLFYKCVTFSNQYAFVLQVYAQVCGCMFVYTCMCVCIYPILVIA